MPLPYKPAADSRHRRACFALYRALVRQGLQIPLPNDILETTKTNIPINKQLAPRSSSYLVSGRKAGGGGGGNPIPTLIINAFRRNRKLTSPRLICLSLKNGYRFLDLFAQAKAQAPPPPPPSQSSLLSSGALTGVRNLFDPSPEQTKHAARSPEQEPLDPNRPIYNQILTFLRENANRVTTHLQTRESNKKPNPFRPHENHTPLLTLLPPSPSPENNNDPDAKPVYIPTVRPRPLAQLTGKTRKLPTLDDCSGYPFLRLSKPQSPVLSVMVWNNARNRQLRIERYLVAKEIELPMSELEDEWEDLVEHMTRVVHMTDNSEPDWGDFSSEMERNRQESLKNTGKGGTRSQGETTDSDSARAEKRKKRWLSMMQKQLQPSNAEGEWVTNKKVQEKGKEEGEERIDWANKEEIRYSESWKMSMEEMASRLRRQHDHWVARGKALWGIVLAERELAEKEAKERGRGLRRLRNSRYEDKIKDWRRAWERKQVRDREMRIREAEERGDLEEAQRLRRRKFRVTAPRRMGFSKRAMRSAT